jgi:large repetitive protein
VTYLLDTTPPLAPGVTGPSGPSNVRTPTFNLSGEAGGVFSCVLTAPGGATTVVPCAAGNLTLDLAGADGIWTLTVTVTDAGGNTSAPTSVTYLLDTTPPAAPEVTGPAGPSNVRTPTFALSGEAGGMFSCLLTAPGGGTSVVPCAAGSLQLDLSGADGIWTLTVTVTDAGGNTSAPTSVTYLLDTTPPATPTVTGPAGPSNDRTPTYTLTGETGGAFSCVLTAPDGTVTSVPCAAGNLTLDLSGPDGTWTLTVTVTDAGGNTSAPTSMTYLLDTTAPEAPAVSGPTGPSNLRTPTYTLTGEEGSSVACVLRSPDGTTTAVPCAAGDLTLDLTGADGTWTLTVTVTDAGGNTSAPTSVAYLLDTTPPAAPRLTGPTGPTSTTSVLVLLEGDADATARCALRAPDGSLTDVPCAAGSLPLELAGPDGTWELEVTLVDAAGNVSAPATWLVTLDTVAPTAPAVRLVQDSDGRFVLETEPGATLSCTLVGPDGQVLSVGCEPGMLDVAVDRLVPGQWRLVVRATDAAGNTSEATTVGFTVAAPLEALVEVEEPSAADEPFVVEQAAPAPAELVAAALLAVVPDQVEAVVRLAVAESAGYRAMQRLRAPGGLGSRWRAMLRVLESAATLGGVPLLLLLLVMAFLALQDRIDRNDPKLALAPVHSHQELPFRPVERRLA